MLLNKKCILTLIASLTIFSGLVADAAVNSEVEAGAKILGANLVDEVKFDEGKTILSDASKKDLQEIVKSARAKGEIAEIKVAVWSDKEYPTDDQKMPKQDVNLANARAQAVKDYLTKNLAINDVNTYNMTERPNPLQKFLNTSSYETKSTLEASGAAPKKGDEGFLFTKAQKGKALLMVYLR